MTIASICFGAFAALILVALAHSWVVFQLQRKKARSAAKDLQVKIKWVAVRTKANYPLANYSWICTVWCRDWREDHSIDNVELYAFLVSYYLTDSNDTLYQICIPNIEIDTPHLFTSLETAKTIAEDLLKQRLKKMRATS